MANAPDLSKNVRWLRTVVDIPLRNTQVTGVQTLSAGSPRPTHNPASTRHYIGRVVRSSSTVRGSQAPTPNLVGDAGRQPARTPVDTGTPCGCYSQPPYTATSAPFPFARVAVTFVVAVLAGVVASHFVKG